MNRLGTKAQHVWQKEINTLSELCYHSLTTLLGSQTLGEEYCDLVQFSQSTQTFPGLTVKSKMNLYVLKLTLFCKATFLLGVH